MISPFMTRLLLTTAFLAALVTPAARAEKKAPKRRPAQTAAQPEAPPETAPEGDARTAEFGPTTNSPIIEVLAADEYVDLTELDPVRDDAINWDPTSHRFLYVSNEAPAFVFLTGTLLPGHELSWDGKWIEPKGNRFQIRVPFPVEPTRHELRVYSPSRKFRSYRYVSHWLKVPSSIRTRTKDPQSAFSRAVGFGELYRNTPSIQLYSGQAASSHVDLDATKHARLTFRVFPAPLPDFTPDGFRLVIRNERRMVVAEVSRLGQPPDFFDWREVATNFHSSGRYTYQLTVYKEKRTYEGAIGEFDAVEGLSLLNHDYLPAFQFEPREEVGYFFYRNQAGVTYSHVYVGADLPVVLWNRFLLRATGLMSLHTPDPGTNLTYTRIGGGFRFFGQGNNDILGTPHIFRIDLYLAHTGFTVYEGAPVQRYSQFAMLLEPHLVLWSYHYIVPWIEFAMKPDTTQERLSFGLSYQFYIRPWSVKLGMGVSYDNLFHFQNAEPMQFSVLRTLTTFTFFL